MPLHTDAATAPPTSSPQAARSCRSCGGAQDYSFDLCEVCAEQAYEAETWRLLDEYQAQLDRRSEP
ncbi:hypothetical protein GO986_12225 [Deinococcus sp. HMF7620]|uniref:Uncharacterized protein n=1 Tax=Deinococcus arboris TaxID=2682977 RepID=A0A7C9HS80_9DEIO|nr:MULTISPECIES: hypothetical protein [Deinococcus]MBZ9752215.1 hypothetical protein [Deinococcus betulae]MVN87532.1 hypothetical protein [Deinococcus arboris]